VSGDPRGAAYEAPLGGDMLINPPAIPVIWTRTRLLQEDAVLLKKRGARLQRIGERIDERWQKLAPHYQAPEGAQLTAGTERPKRKAETAGGHLIQASELLWHFASELEPMAQRLNSLRGEAQDLVNWANGYPTDWARRHYPSGFLDQDGGLGLSGPARSWDNEPSAGAESTRLVGAVADLVGQIKETEGRYARAIRDLVDTTVLPPLETDPEDTRRADRDKSNVAANNGDGWRGVDVSRWGLPWGGPTLERLLRDPPGPARSALGALQGALDIVLFFPRLVGVGVDTSVSDQDRTARIKRDRVSVGWDVAKAAWKGVGKTVTAAIPATYAVPALRRRNLATLKALGEGFIAADEQDPWAQGGKIATNVVSLFAPSPVKGPAGALARVGDDIVVNGAIRALGRSVDVSDGVAGGLRYALKAPEWFTQGKLIGSDVRMLPKVRDLLDSARVRTKGAVLNHALDEVLRERAGAQAGAAGSRARAEGLGRALDDVAHERGLAEGTQIKEAAARNVLDQIEREREAARVELDRLRNREATGGDPAGELQRRLDGIAETSKLRKLDREAQLAQANLDKAAKDAATATERVRQLDRDAGALQRRLDGAASEATATANRISSLDKELVGLVRELDQLDRGPRVGGPLDLADGRLSGLRDAWGRLPEPVRDLVRSDLLRVWEKGPLSVASNLPADFLDRLGGGAQGAAAPAHDAVLDALRPEARRRLTELLDRLREDPELLLAIERVDQVRR
jgi:hypothetical protein